MTLLDAYTRRQTWLARLQAVEVAKILLGKGEASGASGQSKDESGARWVTPAQFFQRAGIKNL